MIIISLHKGWDEYLSVGYECYILNSTELYKKDKRLYDYFEWGGLLDED